MAEVTTVFRAAKSTAVKQGQYAEPSKPADEKVTMGTGNEDVPFLDYRRFNHKPFMADYYGIENIWDVDATITKEVETVEDYLKQQVELGELRNKTEAVKKKIKKLEKMANIDETERTSDKMRKLVAFINYQKELERIKYVSTR